MTNQSDSVAVFNSKYELRDLLGQGGYGRVIRAYDHKIGRDVAIKFILPPPQSSDNTRGGEPDQANDEKLKKVQEERLVRFDSEMRSLSDLRHPNIAKVLDYGLNSIQGPYLVMEYMKEGTLKRNLLETVASPVARTKVIREICSAVSFIHSKGKIHRDIKPDNILFDDSRNALLADFGIVKDLGTISKDGSGSVPDDLSNSVSGTDAYRAPELKTKKYPPTPQSDIYSLGSVVWEMFTGEHYGPAGPGEGLMPPGLSGVLKKALSPEPADRYKSVIDFLTAVEKEDIEGHLVYAAQAWAAAGKPHSELYRGERLARADEWKRSRPADQRDDSAKEFLEESRFKAVADLLRERRLRQIAFALLALSLVATAFAFVQRQIASNTATKLATEVVVRTTAEVVARNEANAQATEVVLRTTAEAIAHNEADARATQVVLRTTAEAVAQQQRDAAQLQARISRASELAAKARLNLQDNPARSLLLAIESINVNRSLSETSPFESYRALRDVVNQTPNSLGLGPSGKMAFAPNGHVLAISGWDKTIRILDLRESEPLAKAAAWQYAVDSPTQLAFSADGQQLFGTSGQFLWAWNWTGNTPDTPTSGWPNVAVFAVDPVGGFLALVTTDGSLHLRRQSDPSSDIAQLTAPVSATVLSFSPDGQWLMAGNAIETLDLYPLNGIARGALQPLVLRHDTPLKNAFFSPDSLSVVASTDDGLISLWDISTSPPTSTLLNNPNKPGVALSFSQNRRWLVVQPPDTPGELWDLKSLTPTQAVDYFPIGGVQVAISSDSRWLATKTDISTSGSFAFFADRAVRVSDLEAADTTNRSVTLGRDDAAVFHVAMSPDACWLITDSFEPDEMSRAWPLPNSRSDCPHIDEPTDTTLDTPLSVISPDGQLLAAAIGKDIQLLQSAPGPYHLSAVLKGHLAAVDHVIFSPDGTKIFSDDESGTTLIWDIGDPTAPKIVATLDGGPGPLKAFALSPDGKSLITSAADQITRLWDVSGMAQPPQAVLWPSETAQALENITFSPDSQWVLASGTDGSGEAHIALWRMAGLAQNPPFRLARGTSSFQAEFSPDSHWLAFKLAGEFTMFDLTRADPLAKASTLTGNGLSDSILGFDFSKDGRWLALSSKDNFVRVWSSAGFTSPPIARISFRSDEPPGKLRFSPDTKWLMIDTANGYWAWKTEPWNTSAILLAQDAAGFSDLDISQDGRWLLWGSWNLGESLWDLNDLTAGPEPLTGFRLFQRPEFSPDGRWAIVRIEKQTWLFDLSLDSLLQIACQKAGHNLSAVDWNRYFPGEHYRQTCQELPPNNSNVVQ